MFSKLLLSKPKGIVSGKTKTYNANNITTTVTLPTGVNAMWVGKLTVEAKWTIKSGELELFFILNGNKNFYSVGSDSSLTLVAVEILGERKEAWEGKEITFKKVK